MNERVRRMSCQSANEPPTAATEVKTSSPRSPRLARTINGEGQTAHRRAGRRPEEHRAGAGGEQTLDLEVKADARRNGDRREGDHLSIDRQRGPPGDSLSEQPITRGAHERQDQEPDDEARNVADHGPPEPDRTVRARRPVGAPERKQDQDRRQHQDARRLADSRHLGPAGPHLRAHGDGAGEIIHRQTAPDSPLVGVETNRGRDRPEQHQRDRAVEEDRRQRDPLLLPARPDDRRHRVDGRGPADHRPRRDQVGQPPGDAQGDRQRARHEEGRRQGRDEPQRDRHELPGLEQARFDPQPHQHHRRAQHRLANERQPRPVTIAPPVVRRQPQPFREGRIDNDRSDNQRHQHVGERPAGREQPLQLERGASDDERQRGTRRHRTDVGGPRMLRRGRGHLLGSPQPSSAIEIDNSGDETVNRPRGSESVRATTVPRVAVSDMSANAIGRRLRTDSDASVDLSSEAMCGAACAWIDIGSRLIDSGNWNLTEAPATVFTGTTGAQRVSDMHIRVGAMSTLGWAQATHSHGRRDAARARRSMRRREAAARWGMVGATVALAVVAAAGCDAGGFFCGSDAMCGWSETDLRAWPRSPICRRRRPPTTATRMRRTPTPSRSARCSISTRASPARRPGSTASIARCRSGVRRSVRARAWPASAVTTTAMAASIRPAPRATSRWAPAGPTPTRSRRSIPRFTLCTSGTAASIRCGPRPSPTTRTRSPPTATDCRRRG